MDSLDQLGSAPYFRKLMVSKGPTPDVLLPIIEYVNSMPGTRTYQESLELAQSSTDSEFPGRQEFLARHGAMMHQIRTTERQIPILSSAGNFDESNRVNFRYTSQVRLCNIRCDYFLNQLRDTLNVGQNKDLLTTNINDLVSDIRKHIVRTLEELDTIYPNPSDEYEAYGPTIYASTLGQILPVPRYVVKQSRLDEELYNSQRCTICLERYSAAHRPIQIHKPCGHTVGLRPCLEEWINSSAATSNQCPVSHIALQVLRIILIFSKDLSPGKLCAASTSASERSKHYPH